jgi:hypothetical protein
MVAEEAEREHPSKQVVFLTCQTFFEKWSLCVARLAY